MGLPEPPEMGASALPTGTFDGQVVIVTGGGTGIGKAIAVEFARLGAKVAIMSRKPEHLDAGLQALADLGAPAMAVGCDIRDPEQIARAFDDIVAKWSLPDVLINNAAANFPVPAEDMSPNAWRTVVDITLNGTFFMTREFARRRWSTWARRMHGPAAQGSRTPPRPRRASRTWSRRSRSSGALTVSR
jgi:NAD(P)-dependent dehydrogenase (short-subunit alcohol dehydrogenase family)